MFVTRDGLDFLGAQRASFGSARPFPHISVDGLFDNRQLKELVDLWPTHHVWQTFNNVFEKKMACSNLSLVHPLFTRFFRTLNGSDFVSSVARMTGIDNLIHDNGLLGGGLHCHSAGGKLDVHEDFNVHNGLMAWRRVNLIVYLNEDWPEEYGGHLQLWDKDLTKCEVSLLPTFNRTVIFRTDMNSNHGCPIPISCPTNRQRRSLAAYYYEPLTAEERVEYTSTHFKKLPGDVTSEEDEAFRERIKSGR